MGLTVIKTGTTGVTLNFTTIDNMLSVDINPDGPQGNGKLGWSRVFEANASGLGYYGGNYSITLDQYLHNYKHGGASSVTLAIVASNWTAGGSIAGTLSYDGGSTPISLSPGEWSSQQQALTLTW